MSEKIRISTIQTSMEWENKEKNLRMYEDKINSLSSQIVVLPEMFSTGFTMNAKSLSETMKEETVEWMMALARKKNIVITGSTIIKENEKYFNRLLWVAPNGTIQHYDKHHLFSFAGENNHYTAGTKRLTISYEGWTFCPMICYDLRFPVWNRQQYTRSKLHSIFEYDVILYVASWPKRRIDAWDKLLMARAIENQSYVVAVNRVGLDGNNHEYSGHTSVIDPFGNIVYTAIDREEVHTIELQKSTLEDIRKTFPFANEYDKFTIED